MRFFCALFEHKQMGLSSFFLPTLSLALECGIRRVPISAAVTGLMQIQGPSTEVLRTLISMGDQSAGKRCDIRGQPEVNPP